MKGLLITAALIVTGTTVIAQSPGPMRIELRPFAGAYVPTGKLADDFKTAVTGGAEAALEITPRLHVLATGSWTNSHHKFAGMTNDRTNLWQYDVGAEFTVAEAPVGTWTFRPFVGLGGGGRTYDYQHAGMSSSTQLAGYASIGHEALFGAIGIRCEARDYMSRYKSPLTTKTTNRNDLGFTFGVAFHF